MNRYLLLRDNKQTGPYTVAELAEKGIKAYDLVWLDGKSAAWRYPSEVEELKPISPVVEEQPFDRFFKKPSDKEIVTESALERARKRAMAEAANAAIQYSSRETTLRKVETTEIVPHTKEAEEVREFVLPVDAKTSSKKVYVDLPGKKAGVRPEPVQTPEPAAQKVTAATVVAVIKDQPAAEPVQIAAPVKTEHQRYMPATELSVKHESSEPDEFSSGFDSDTSTSRVEMRPMIPAPAKKSSGPAPVMLLIGALCLLLGGVVIGLFISNSSGKNSGEDLGKIIEGIKARDEEKKAAQQKAMQVSQVSQSLPAETDQVVYVPSSEEQTVSKPGSTKKVPVSAGTQPRTSEEIKQPALNTTSLPVQKNDETGARNSVTREDKPQVTVASENARKNIRQLVSVQKNKYRTGVLGGISDLELTLSNNSEFELDVVEVEIAYLGPERRVINTQTIVFNNVKPGKQSVQDVPRSKRGVTVNTTIRSIQSKSLGLAHSGL